MDDDSYYGCSHRHKRTRAAMEGDGPSSAWSTPFHLPSSAEDSSSASPPQRRLVGLGLPHIRGQRYPGDGMDFRRPIASNTVIDLTEDDAGPSRPPQPAETIETTRASRPPRFHREIIDIEEEPEPAQPSLRAPARPVRAPDSPEVEFISARTIDPPRRPPPNPNPFHGNHEIDLTDDDFYLAFEEHHHGRHGHPLERRAALDVAVGQQMDIMMRTEQMRQRLFGGGGLQRLMGLGGAREPELRRQAPGRPRENTIIQFAAPELNFAAVGFDLGFERERPDPPAPTYKKPDAASEGFTRSPEEDEVLICPNCTDELCSGTTDLKKQVWIVKGCGHVYCGECTENRFKSTRGKAKSRAVSSLPPTFKSCVVDGCTKKVHTKTSMIQVYL